MLFSIFLINFALHHNTELQHPYTEHHLCCFHILYNTRADTGKSSAPSKPQKVARILYTERFTLLVWIHVPCGAVQLDICSHPAMVHNISAYQGTQSFSEVLRINDRQTAHTSTCTLNCVRQIIELNMTHGMFLLFKQ